MNTQLKKQNGAALVVGLVMLLVMTLIGVTSMNATRTELKIANNIKNHSNAFQTAAIMFERALVDPLIDWISASTTPLQGSYVGGYNSGDGLRSGVLNVVFIGCRSSSGSSLTGRGGKYLIHQVSVSGNELNSAGEVVGVSRQAGGYTTTAAGCESL
jgi:type IV pilus assembly PilX-like protein